ncbi:MAG TPA: chromosome segregation protein SMC, partial [Gammaproteobacteria bacterium]|nr:chromosome segregation protein SMC [Gammaproteobacteria bacterium]
MRLSKIKLAGFKSFVDPTTIPFPSNRIGIVGPNGCGKSNVIDAVRWVMGEASAKHLRGDSMADVIFNGSTGRKPVGKAAVELVFDNADGGAGGQYASYSEIAIRREVSRDGASSYFLNGTRCRRRDITDIFLGTGLGPRSYAIIEQGMIARIIEAKPEELRVFFEEAAGISKYKERRRETENRIRHTRENIERLNDLRDEINKNLDVLKRQARSAERYKEMAAEARQLKAELLALKYREMDTGMADKDRVINERENAVESAVAQLRHAEADIEKQRSEHTAAQDTFNDVQGRFYTVGAEIARLEQAIEHARELRQRQEKDLAQTEHQHSELENHAKRDSDQIDDLSRVLGELEPGLTRATQAQQTSSDQLAQAEDAMQEWQTRWDAFTQQANESSQSANVERTRIDHLDSQLQQALNRLEKLRTERGNLSGQSLGQEISELEKQAEEAIQARDTAQRELEQALTAISEQREQDKTLNADLHAKRSALENSRGRLASLEALQQSALGKSRSAVNDWLADNQLANLPRLAEQLQVDEGWERAVETVLGFYLQAVCVEELDATANALTDLEQGAVALLEPSAGRSAVENNNASLAAHVRCELPLDFLLAGVKTAANLNEALAQRHTLAAGESFITPDGIWLGSNWLRVNREEDENAGVLAREQ